MKVGFRTQRRAKGATQRAKVTPFGRGSANPALVLAITFVLALFASPAHAGCPGCCSSHGGITNSCASNGRVYCQDGTVSPTCTCAACGVPTTPPPPPPAPGQLAVPLSVTFPAQVVETTSSPSIVTVTNTGGQSVVVQSIGSSNPSEFAVASSTCGTVGVGLKCSFGLVFRPGAPGSRNATVTITSTGLGSPQGISVSGVATTLVTPPPADTVLAVEYHHAAFDHYFVTAISDEIAKLDNGTFVGWARTGQTFKVRTSGGAGRASVCRFFTVAFPPTSSHFYAPRGLGCEGALLNPQWQLEGDVFYTALPDSNGMCPSGEVPVYRMYNNGQGGAPNHRFTTSIAMRTQMLAQGYIAEGTGIGVGMCSPQ